MTTRTYNIISLVCGIWFMLTGWFWGYFINLVLSYPFGLVGIYFWNKARKIDPGNKLNKASLIVHVVGLLLSAVMLIIILIDN